MEASAPSKISKANTTFSLDFFIKLSDEDKTANIFYSPFSISSALAMVMLGAAGNTATQISEVLHFTEPEVPKDNEPQQMQTQSLIQTRTRVRKQQGSRLPEYLRKCLKPQNGDDDVHTSFAQLLSELNKEGAPYALSVANRLYGEQTYKFVKDFLAATRNHYSAELESVDFKNNTEAARININTWVEEQTQGKIKDLLAPDVLKNSTILVLINAIYFKGTWEKQFKEDFTFDAEFRLTKNNTMSVKMMRQKSEFALASIPEINCKVLEMPYKGKDLSMLIFLPNEIEDDTTGLEKLEKELTYEKFVEWTRPDLMGERKVEVSLPRFKMEKTYDLNDVLISMGIVDAFDNERSNFSAMSPDNDLVVSKVIHKAFVEVNEEGTEAAAATAVVIVERTSVIIHEIFNADHPFLFFIRHNPSMSILFAGRYCSPE